MTRNQVVQILRNLSGNRYLLAGELNEIEGFHVRFEDLEEMNGDKVNALLSQVSHDVTDKGIWFKVR